MVQLTKVEKLDAEHPGLRQDIDLLLDRGENSKYVALVVARKYAVPVSERMVQHYRSSRWAVMKLRIESVVATEKGILEIVKQYPEEDRRAAEIHKKLHEMSPELLNRRDIALRRLEVEKQEIEIEKQRAENEKAALELKVQQLERERTSERQEIAQVVGDEKAAADDIRRRIREIYGIFEPAAERPPALSVPGTVDQG